MRLVCFPHAGGSASYYLPMAKGLAPEVDVAVLQYPGRQDRLAEPVIDNVDELADAIVAQVRGQIDERTAFFGHSMGATLAFEVTRRLEQAGEQTPLGLFLSGRRPPSIQRPDETVHLRDDDGLIDELRTLGGSDETLLDDPELRAMILPAVRGDYTAIETYRGAPDATVRCPIEVLVGLEDPRATEAEVNVWRKHTTGEVRVTTFPGAHFYLAAQQQAVNGLVLNVLRTWSA
jgi:surfactin synthase thioesterase subunit